MDETTEVTDAVTDDLPKTDIPEFLQRPFPSDSLPKDARGEDLPREKFSNEHPAVEFRAAHPYTERDKEVIAQLEKQQAEGSKEAKEAKKQSAADKREEERAEEERLRAIRVKLRLEQHAKLPKQEWE